MTRALALHLGMVFECFGCNNQIFPIQCKMYDAYDGQAEDQHGRMGGCAGRTHGRGLDKDVKQFKLNPLKASKRSRGRK